MTGHFAVQDSKGAKSELYKECGRIYERIYTIFETVSQHLCYTNCK